MLSERILHFIKEDVRQLFMEGGLWGHMSHLYEDPSLTFGDIKNVFTLASEGKLENVTEKTDGQNVFFSYDLQSGTLRFARNKSHIKNGGIDAKDIIEKWKNIPHIRDAYHNAYMVLSRAIKSLDKDTLKKIFGNNANIWYSAEIIYSGSPNVINYDRNALAIHRSGTVYDKNGNPVSDVSWQENFETLRNAINSMQKVVSSTGWTIMGPVVLQLKQATDKSVLKNAIAALNSEMSKYDLTDNNTIRDYIARKFAVFVKSLIPEINDEQASQLGEIFANDNISAGEKKKMALKIHPSKKLKEVFLTKNAGKILKSLIKPLEMIVHHFAVGVLEGIQSIIALHPAKEVKRLQQVVASEIEKIRNANDEHALEVLAQQLEKLRSVDKITSSAEGITFTYKGKTYKLTGNFAPINQILGLIRYKR